MRNQNESGINPSCKVFIFGYVIRLRPTGEKKLNCSKACKEMLE